MSSKKGRDDKKYILLMESYKRLRRELGPKANMYLDAAIKLREEGEVSEDAIRGAQYL